MDTSTARTKRSAASCAHARRRSCSGRPTPPASEHAAWSHASTSRPRAWTGTSFRGAADATTGRTNDGHERDLRVRTLRRSRESTTRGAVMMGNLKADEIEDVLRSEVIGRIACVADGWPYIVPVTYVYDGGEYVFSHSAEGEKVAAMRKNPQVCF